MNKEDLMIGREYLGRYGTALRAIEIIEETAAGDAMMDKQLKQLKQQAQDALGEITKTLATLPLSEGKNMVILKYIKNMTITEICQEHYVSARTLYLKMDPVIAQIGQIVKKVKESKSE